MEPCVVMMRLSYHYVLDAFEVSKLNEAEVLERSWMAGCGVVEQGKARRPHVLLAVAQHSVY